MPQDVADSLRRKQPPRKVKSASAGASKASAARVPIKKGMLLRGHAMTGRGHANEVLHGLRSRSRLRASEVMEHAKEVSNCIFVIEVGVQWDGGLYDSRGPAKEFDTSS